VVEDEQEILAQFTEQISEKGYEVLAAHNGVEAWEIFQGTAILVVVTDISMPFKNGLQILAEIKKRNPATRVIIVTGFGGEPEAIKALKLHAFDFIQKGLDTTADELLDAIKRAFQDVHTQVTAEKQMLAFLTHTLSNTISGGPVTVEQVLEDAQSMLGDRYREPDVERFINNVASLKAIFLAMANMLRAYKIFVSKPELFEQKWFEDTGGNQSFDLLLSTVLKQTLSSLLFEETNVDQLERIAMLTGSSVASVREAFLEDLLWSEKAVSPEPEQVVRWCERNFPIISVTVTEPPPAFNLSGVRYAFLLSVLTEIVYNALKYTDGRQPIRIAWRKQDQVFRFICNNTFSEASTQSVGSQKGLEFVSNLSQMIEGIEIVHRNEHETFTVELRLQESLLNQGASI
jgi:DNA-binding response OmpR family regulator